MLRCGAVPLGAAVAVVTGAVLWLTHRATGGDGVTRLAAAPTAGTAAAVPAIVAAANPACAPAASTATALVAVCVAGTAILVPVVTARRARIVGTEPSAASAERDRGIRTP